LRDFLGGLGFGLILQIAVGPVCVAVLHRALIEGFGHAFAMIWGAALVDTLYIILSVVGISALLQIGSVRVVLGVAGALLLAAFGLHYLRAPAATERLPQNGGSHLKSFATGVGLTLTNPLTILFWAGALGAMMSTHTFDQPGGVVLFSAGCVAATLLFLTAVAAAAHFAARLLTERRALWLNRAVGLFLIGFALKLAIDLAG
jgi:threonine/homoserine/homoserine lactone efflux protein